MFWFGRTKLFSSCRVSIEELNFQSSKFRHICSKLSRIISSAMFQFTALRHIRIWSTTLNNVHWDEQFPVLENLEILGSFKTLKPMCEAFKTFTFANLRFLSINLEEFKINDKIELFVRKNVQFLNIQEDWGIYLEDNLSCRVCPMDHPTRNACQGNCNV